MFVLCMRVFVRVVMVASGGFTFVERKGLRWLSKEYVIYFFCVIFLTTSF